MYTRSRVYSPIYTVSRVNGPMYTGSRVYGSMYTVSRVYGPMYTGSRVYGSMYTVSRVYGSMYTVFRVYAPCTQGPGFTLHVHSVPDSFLCASMSVVLHVFTHVEIIPTIQLEGNPDKHFY